MKHATVKYVPNDVPRKPIEVLRQNAPTCCGNPAVAWTFDGVGMCIRCLQRGKAVGL